MTPVMSIALTIIAVIVSLWFLFVLSVVLFGAYGVIAEHVRMTRRRKELRARLRAQGAPFNRLEVRTGVRGRLA